MKNIYKFANETNHMATLVKLTEIKNLREAWPHEALDFTPLLAEDYNMTILCDAVSLDITVDETEYINEIQATISTTGLSIKKRCNS